MSWQNKRRKKPKQKVSVTKEKKKKRELEMLKEVGVVLSKYFSHFSLQFSLQFEDIVFWKGRRENLWAPPLFALPPPLSQTPFPLIFSPIFHSFFSILPKIHPTKYNLRLCLITIFVFENIKKKQFSYIFEIKNMFN